ncbi:Sister chromatid cohesion protein [Wickerhamomyces ciferrii]|uniref:Sister chromatid cohesion protein n=1 Tax=Wickerhamomyces ciferrii (strain ATCC 14091 / BCRC 22168 / CBS 111 / JCM 3599 / NBRC 0793 / NRRL Y-1031 F-60-10) TaxID=1206466 RepID=K0KG62_WICCF|nr:Sister chromatid cohesion protein [Wickerhamomyces ciferrii]CCH41941.1 Sister chromatid cohesion protein [Wickerhamomyces ciferrii]
MTVSRLPKLKFKKNIVSSPGESISTLSTELSKIDQDKFDVKSLDKIKNDLINKKLINHKDSGVQSLVACCISDILRIYAPDAPYTDGELTSIFKLFISSFKRLSDQNNGFYTQQVYLITRLAEVRSIILITDIEDNTKLIEELFELFYDTSKTFHKKLEPIISDILIEIISEWDQISSKVLKLILNKFLTNTKEGDSITSNLSSSSCSPFNFTLAICDANPDRLARQVTKFFSEVLFENNESESDDSEIQFKNLKKLHTLSVEIWKYTPEVLGSVMGLIDNELNAENVKYRILATETIGKILASNSRLNFVQTHKETWANWLKKTLDISPQVRNKWVEEGSKALVNRNDVLVEISNGLGKTLIDTDERVRLVSTKAIAQLPTNVITKRINNKTILNGLLQLAREKHPEIREEAVNTLANLFNDSYNDIYFNEISDNDEISKILKQIPNHILSLLYINDKNINYLVDLVLVEKILPFEDDELKRVERILNVFQSLDEKGKASFLAFNRRQQQLSGVLTKFIEFSEESNGGTNDDASLQTKIEKTINWLSVALPDKYDPQGALNRFIKINNRRLYYLIKLTLSSSSDYETIRNSSKELFNRLQDSKIINSVDDETSISITDIFKTFKILIYRASLNFYNKSNISSLLRLSDNAQYGKSSQELINNISTITPAAFQNQVHDLVKLIKESTPSNQGKSKVNTLRALFHIFHKMRDYLDDDDSKFFEKIVQFASQGTPLEAKFAVKIISLSKNDDALSYQLFELIYPFDPESENFVSHLAVISQFFLTQHSIVEEKANEITPFLIKNVLLTNSVIGQEDDPVWIDDEDVENGEEGSLTSKLLALKIFTNRLRSLSESDVDSDETIKSIAEHVLKLLVSLIGNGGEIVSRKSGTYPTPRHYQTRLRLEAGLNLLKLAKIPRYNKLIKPTTLNRLILLIQDEDEHVRSIFIHKLISLLKSEVISLKFLPLVYFIAFEPNESLKNEIKTWIKFSFTKKTTQNSNSPKNIVFEKSLTGLLHSIAHHPEFLEYIKDEELDEEERNLKAFTFALEYIVLFLETVATENNISLLYYFATRLKQYRDALFTDKDFQEQNNSIFNIYRISELAQITIKELQIHKNWNLNTYPGKIDLSSELFTSTKTSEEGQEIVRTSYIPEVVLKNLKIKIKQKISSIHLVKRLRQQVHDTEDGETIPKPKRVKSVSKPKKPKKSNKPSKSKEIVEPVRKSTRAKRVSYANQEIDDDEDEEMEEDEEEEEESGDYSDF